MAELEAALSTTEVYRCQSRLNPGNHVVFRCNRGSAKTKTAGVAVTYQIVGDLEADIKQRLIAVSSPITRTLIGGSSGDSFEFTAPNGVKHYEITGVRYS